MNKHAEKQRAFSDSYRAVVSEIISRELPTLLSVGNLRNASHAENRQQAFDLVSLDDEQPIDFGVLGSVQAAALGLAGKTGLTIGYRIRKSEYMKEFADGFTFRVGPRVGTPLDSWCVWKDFPAYEFQKVTFEGCLDLYFFGVVDETEHGKVLRYKLIDMAKYRAYMAGLKADGISPVSVGRFFAASDNWFYACKQRMLPKDAVIVERGLPGPLFPEHDFMRIF